MRKTYYTHLHAIKKELADLDNAEKKAADKKFNDKIIKDTPVLVKRSASYMIDAIE